MGGTGGAPDLWRSRARCSGKPLQEFFDLSSEQVDLAAEAGERRVTARELSRLNDEQRLRAKAVCLQCPVRMDCLADQMSYEERHPLRHGVYGGLDPEERALLHFTRTAYDSHAAEVETPQHGEVPAEAVNLFLDGLAAGVVAELFRIDEGDLLSAVRSEVSA